MGSVAPSPPMSTPSFPVSTATTDATAPPVPAAANGGGDERVSAEVYSVTSWPTSTLAAQIPRHSSPKPSNGLPQLDPPKDYVWANIEDGKSHPVPVHAHTEYTPPTPMDDGSKNVTKEKLDESFGYHPERELPPKLEPLQKVDNATELIQSIQSQATPSDQQNPDMTSSLKSMDIDGEGEQDLDGERDAEHDTEQPMDVDKPTSASAEKPSESSEPSERRQFSLSHSVDWTPTTGTPQAQPNGEDAAAPPTAREPLAYHAFHDKPAQPRLVRQPSDEDREPAFSAPPPMAPRLIARGPRGTGSLSPVATSASVGGKSPPPIAPLSNPEPISGRQGSQRRAATRSRIVTTQQVQHEEDEEEDYGESEREEEDEPEKVDRKPVSASKVRTVKDPNAPEGQEDAYELDDEDAGPVSKKRGRPPGSASAKAQKKRKTGDRYPCTVDGCTKTFTRRNDVERHMKSSGAHPDLKNMDDTKRCGLCGTDLSRADARLRHERTNACGKRNLQQGRTKLSASPVKAQKPEEAST